MPEQQSNTPPTSTEPISAGPIYQREEDFISEYANNIRFESTVHDLKLIFGQTDLSSGREVVIQHTAITLPWSVLKLALFFIRLNLDFHELYNGRKSVV